MDKLVISKDLKLGKQEILLDPTLHANKCGSEVDALVLNDLYFVEYAADGSIVRQVPAVDWILQDRISIENAQATVEGNSITITWVGDNAVQLQLDDSVPFEYTDTTQNSYTFTGVAAGEHTVRIRALRDRRGLEVTVTIAEDAELYVITFN